MDLVKLSITGGLALASVLMLLSTARQGAAEPAAQPPFQAQVYDPAARVAAAPVMVDPTAPTPLVRLSSDPAYGGLSLFPAAPGSTRPATFDERWRGVPSAWDGYIDEASHRFGVPASWIRSVMRAESDGQQFLNGLPITSPKGAMGLMQVMPDTYAGLRARYGFGPDPYDPRDNVLAGTAYIREMYERFGAPGFLAAYNAGPGRVGDFLARGRPLPDETRHYLADVGSRVVRSASATPTTGVVRVAEPVQDLTASALVPARAFRSPRAPISPEAAPLFVASAARGTPDRLQSDAPASDGLFVVLGATDRRRARSEDDAREN